MLLKYQKDISDENKRKIISCLLNGPKDWKSLLEYTKLSKATLAAHIKELEELGLIITEIDKKDRRKKIYRLNEKYSEQRDILLTTVGLSNQLGKYLFKGLFQFSTDEEKVIKFLKDFEILIGKAILSSLILGEPYLSVSINAVKELIDFFQDEGVRRELDRKNLNDLLSNHAKANIKTFLSVLIPYSKEELDAWERTWGNIFTGGKVKPTVIQKKILEFYEPVMVDKE